VSPSLPLAKIACREENDDGADGTHDKAERDVAAVSVRAVPEGYRRLSTRLTVRLATMRVMFDIGSKMASAIAVMRDKDGISHRRNEGQRARRGGAIYLKTSQNCKEALDSNFVFQMVVAFCLLSFGAVIVDRL
jgi:hypothetical protein